MAASVAKVFHAQALPNGGTPQKHLGRFLIAA